MRKSLFTLLLMFALAIANVCNANDPWYDLGQSLGQAMVNPNIGNSDKNFYQDPMFDFSTIKGLCIIAAVEPTQGLYISNPRIADEYPFTMMEVFNKEKADSTYKVLPFTAVSNYYAQNVMPQYPILTGQQHVQQIFNTLNQEGIAILYVRVLAYSQDFQFPGVGNCFIKFSVMKNGQEVMYYSDQRLNSPRSSKEGMSKRIAKAFFDKFDKAYKKNS